MAVSSLTRRMSFFAAKERLIQPQAPVFIDDKYDDHGKWMDGWESRRKRSPGHDHCIIRLGVPGVIHGVEYRHEFLSPAITRRRRRWKRVSVMKMFRPTAGLKSCR